MNCYTLVEFYTNKLAKITIKVLLNINFVSSIDSLSQQLSDDMKHYPFCNDYPGKILEIVGANFIAAYQGAV